MVKCRTLCSDMYWSKILRLSDSQRCIHTNRNTFKNWNFHFQTTDLLSNYNNVKTHNIISNIISSTAEIGRVGKNRTGRNKNRTRNVKDDEYPLTPNCVSPQTLLDLFSIPPFPSQLYTHCRVNFSEPEKEEAHWLHVQVWIMYLSSPGSFSDWYIILWPWCPFNSTNLIGCASGCLELLAVSYNYNEKM